MLPRSAVGVSVSVGDVLSFPLNIILGEVFQASNHSYANAARKQLKN
jgi:hypothetical protein